MLKVYTITLCKEDKVSYPELFNTNFSIKLHYHTLSSGNWIGDRSLAEIQNHYNLTKEEYISYKKQFDKFFPSVKNGDEILMNFGAEGESNFYYNGEFFGSIKDRIFAVRFANIWLHPNSTFKDTRNFLLQE